MDLHRLTNQGYQNKHKHMIILSEEQYHLLLLELAHHDIQYTNEIQYLHLFKWGIIYRHLVVAAVNPTLIMSTTRLRNVMTNQRQTAR